MHPKMGTFCIEIPAGDEKKMAKFQEIMDEHADAMVKHIDDEAKRLKISWNDMADIAYLRTRGRWTQEKEDHLISLARQGKELPNVLAGDF